VAGLRVYLDANVMFSAALGGDSFVLLWELAYQRQIRLLTSEYCRLEAELNLERKRSDAYPALAPLLDVVEIVPPGGPDDVKIAESLVVLKDAAVLASALAARADVLLTGDLRHFGELMTRTDLPLRVRTVRAFLLGGY
jgi:uncharacterized protein